MILITNKSESRKVKNQTHPSLVLRRQQRRPPFLFQITHHATHNQAQRPTTAGGITSTCGLLASYPAQAGRGLWVEGANKPNLLFPSYLFFSWFKSEEIKETPDLIIKDSWICGNMECVVGELLRYIKLIVRKVDVLQSCEMRKVSRNFAREFVVS